MSCDRGFPRKAEADADTDADLLTMQICRHEKGEAAPLFVYKANEKAINNAHSIECSVNAFIKRTQVGPLVVIPRSVPAFIILFYPSSTP